MSLNLKIARFHGIDVYIHWTFWLLPLWIIFTWTGAGMFPLWMYLLLIAGLFTCVVLHEFGHALMAQRFGIRTRNITLTPIGGIAQLERMSHKPMEEFLIAIAGPLVNVGIAAVLGAVLLGSFAFFDNIMETIGWQFLSVLWLMNVVMVVFNMIPAFPMDGGRVFRAVLASFLGLLQGTRVAVTVGTVVAALMGFAGMFLLGNPWLLLIGFFVIFAGQQELRALEEAEQRRVRVAEIDDLPPILSGSSHGRPLMNLTILLWDPVRRAWVRRTYPQV